MQASIIFATSNVIDSFMSECKVARWLSRKYRTLGVAVSLVQIIELFAHVLSGITIIIILDKNTGKFG